MRYGVWAPIPQTVSGVRKWLPGRAGRNVTAVVIHRMDGTLDGSDSWLRSARSGSASTHFGVGAMGWLNRALYRWQIRQWVDTHDTAYGWAARPTDTPTDLARRTLVPDLYTYNADLNWQVIAVEVEGFYYQPWAPGLAKKVQELLWAIARVHGPLVVMAHTDCSVKPCPGMTTFQAAMPGWYGSRLVLPDTSVKTEDAMFNKWVPRILPTTGTMTLPSGTAVYRHPYVGQSFTRTSASTQVTVTGRVAGDSIGGKSRWFIYTLNAGGLALVPEVNATNIKVQI